MIQRYSDGFVLICDICGEESEITFDSFQDAVDQKSDIDWKSQKIDGVWADVCPDCQEAGNE